MSEPESNALEASEPMPQTVPLFRTSQDIGALSEALGKAQLELVNPRKSKTATVHSKRTGQTFTYKYSDIADGVEIISKVFGKHGLCYVQIPCIDGAFMTLVTRIAHASGQWIEGTYPVCRIGADHQEMGSALTYARRYSLFPMAGIAAEEDIDGNGAAEPIGEEPKPAEAPPPSRGNRIANRTKLRGEEKPPQEEVAPILPVEESTKAADKLIASLEKVSTRGDALQWAQDNSSIKRSLQHADSDRVEAAFRECQRKLSKPAEAA